MGLTAALQEIGDRAMDDLESRIRRRGGEQSGHGRTIGDCTYRHHACLLGPALIELMHFLQDSLFTMSMTLVCPIALQDAAHAALTTPTCYWTGLEYKEDISMRISSKSAPLALRQRVDGAAIWVTFQTQHMLQR